MIRGLWVDLCRLVSRNRMYRTTGESGRPLRGMEIQEHDFCEELTPDSGYIEGFGVNYMS